MPDSYDLTQLDPNSFEHLVNHLALRALGLGVTGFSPGSDGGRDGYFEGEAPYPSETDRWSGSWYLQSKFHKPHLSKDPQKWLVNQIKAELKEFKDPESGRKLPDNWIVVTNIDPSGTPETGAFDQANELVAKECPALKNNFHIWGGRKIIDLLILHPEISNHYRHFLTPGNILTEIYDQLKDAQAEVKTILRFLILSQFDEQQYTKLEQAGGTERPGIHKLFVDLPFRCQEYNLQDLVMPLLLQTSAKCHRINEQEADTKEWQIWNKHPSRAKVWFLKGGPGQGKSTITQFFCQIQRAALILNKEVPNITTKQRSLANELRKAIESNNFWTSVLRIPINIELKDFAQWFGRQKEKNKACGVLTYLAEFISNGVEQEVKAGTLKRLLGNRSWVIVFDGLDEVPQDVKDAVASEVCRFVNNVAVEINADLLTLCTSRPQGYSGQFEDLDGPTIELIHLSAEQALMCAKPLLELDRTTNEAKKAIEILTSAIESPAVRELMTTPLQSHIMAVVVRDGERPPQRRWKLFNNFYQVIKRREANRNLPDKRLAKLLREEEKLLKTVHNRLGFVLHARAESSQGARTNLEHKHDFKKLVTDAVSQMVETPSVNETIDVLMRATMERLVLVSTPTDGNYVRFDIRPLQEFFAAEFIYESVDAEQLRQRVEIIASDAHWREVMYFLLSAIIENERETEIAVVVDVLVNINEGDDDNLNLLKRRLGRGAILTAKLLQEGVLEQDKRIRQKFRKCLEPLAASLEIELLYPLIQVSQTNSQSWLYSFLISCIEDKNFPESIGAAIILSHILPDNHEKIEQVTNFLVSSPPSYISALLTTNLFLRDTTLKTPSKFMKKWFFKIIIEIILSSKWTLLAEEAFISCLDIISCYHKQFFHVFNDLAILSNKLKIFEVLLNDKSYANSSSVIKVAKKYGFIEIVYFQGNWLEGIALMQLENELNNMPIILGLIYLISRFIQEKNKCWLTKLITFLENKNINNIDAILLKIEMSINIDYDGSIIEKLEYLNTINDKDFEDLWNKQPDKCPLIPHRRIRQIDSKNKNRVNLESWKSLINDEPYIAIHFWKEEEINRNEDLNIILINKIIENPHILLSSIEVWGDLIQLSGERENKLREVLLSVCLQPVSNRTRYKQLFDFSYFELNLPSEAALLPHILNYLLPRQHTRQHNIYRSRRFEDEHQVISEIISNMIHKCSDLTEIYQNLSFDQNIRAAAMITLILHPDGMKYFTNFKQQIVGFYNAEVGNWYIRAITTCLCLLAREEDKDARWIVSNLLEVTKSDYESRQYLSGLLTVWRESSQSPIQRANVQEKWLSGE
ncbi:hypothetical protein [Trichormus variabilis]|uniref:NACHT domain-containing protein n=1 Tax=Trichormus variabilis SAG 1403-4b TaxID=447716 RepID=A0A433UIJ3_ANAVA|nr:hypothetical protein [Trichormus variabilis]MBD2629500.1 hypothetical protein [Trichormus variabilis FACHB-164]RUS93645.1 hypothetical protein DSM107003_41460 [Trichormus variabilis SAG 1403-4b]